MQPNIIISDNVKEFFIEKGNISATCTEWANKEGCNLMIQDGRQNILQGSVRWEELELLNMITAAMKI